MPIAPHQQGGPIKPGAEESLAFSQESKSHPTECEHMQPAFWHQGMGLLQPKHPTLLLISTPGPGLQLTSEPLLVPLNTKDNT